MEVLVFALFYISALIKCDLESGELIINEEENTKDKDKVAEEIQKEGKVAGEGNIEPQKELKKAS